MNFEFPQSKKNIDPGILVRRGVIDVLIHSRAERLREKGRYFIVRETTKLYLFKDAYPIEYIKTYDLRS